MTRRTDQRPEQEKVGNIRPRPKPKPDPAQRRRSERKSKEYPDYAVFDPKRIPEGPDVLVDVPVAKFDEIDVEVDDLHAQVAVYAEIKKILMLSLGADARLGQVELNIQGIEAQALLKARLKNVHGILERVALTLDRSPELLGAIGRGIDEIGHGTGEMLADTGETVEETSEGAEAALKDVGQGSRGAVGSVGKGAGQAVSDVGKGAGGGVAGAGRGIKRGSSGAVRRRAR
jgi:hypothetical protein